MARYDSAIWHGADFIFIDYPLYYELGREYWSDHKDLTIQYNTIPPLDGLPMFVKDFQCDRPQSAKLTFSALGCVDIWINGNRVGNDELKPGWSEYNKRALYLEYDIKDYLVDGQNRILAVVSNGWYSGRIVNDSYGANTPAVMMCLDIDGEYIVTDESWLATVGGQILNADIWDGEYRDSRIDSYRMISTVGYGADNWKKPKIADYFDKEVTPFIGSKVQIRPNLEQKPVTMTVHEGVKDNGTEFGEAIVVDDTLSYPKKAGGERKITIDLGQEIVGWAKIKVRGKSGTTLKIRYAEMLNDSGSKDRGNDDAKGLIYTINYRSAKSKALFVLNGSDEQEYRTTFSFFGFRYIELSADGEFELLDICGEVVGNVNEEVGHIETSDAMINKLISNIIWGQRSNYLYVPTDCPQRDERLGWTGDTQAFSVTAAYNADVLGFFCKWLQDLRDSQDEKGTVPDVVPGLPALSRNASGWGDVCVIVPYNMYMMYGDKGIIEVSYDSMEKYIESLTENGKLSGAEPRYGDWLAYDLCKKEFISSAYFVHIIDLMIEMSEVIGKTDRAEYYKDLRKKAYGYFCDNFMENGELKSKTQAEYAITIAFDLLDPDYMKKAAKELVAKIRENGNRLSTGFLGTYNLCPALSKMGEDNMAYTLLMQREEPSWLYSIDQGATTIWERWNSYTIKNGFGDVGMNSFNHYAYGAVEEWMYRYMAGIEHDGAGFEQILLQPRIDTRSGDELPTGQTPMKWVKASYRSNVGLIESNWSTEDGFLYECTVPEGATATLMLPLFGDKIIANTTEHSVDDFEIKDGCAVIKLGAGKYSFEQNI